MSSIKYIIGQYTRVNSFIRSRGCAALDRINEFTREYCPITYTKFYALCVFRTAVAYTVILLTTETILNILHPSRFINSREMLVFHHVGLFFLDSLLYMCGGILYDIRQWHDYFWRIIIRIWPKNVWKIVLLFTSFQFITHGISVIRFVHCVHFAMPCSYSRVPCYCEKAAWVNQTKIWDLFYAN